MPGENFMTALQGHGNDQSHLPPGSHRTGRKTGSRALGSLPHHTIVSAAAVQTYEPDEYCIFFIWNSVCYFLDKTKIPFLFICPVQFLLRPLAAASVFGFLGWRFVLCNLAAGSIYLYLSLQHNFAAGNHQCGLFRYPAACFDSDSCLFIACLLAGGAQRH